MVLIGYIEQLQTARRIFVIMKMHTYFVCVPSASVTILNKCKYIFWGYFLVAHSLFVIAIRFLSFLSGGSLDCKHTYKHIQRADKCASPSTSAPTSASASAARPDSCLRRHSDAWMATTSFFSVGLFLGRVQMVCSPPPPRPHYALTAIAVVWPRSHCFPGGSFFLR